MSYWHDILDFLLMIFFVVNFGYFYDVYLKFIFLGHCILSYSYNLAILYNIVGMYIISRFSECNNNYYSSKIKISRYLSIFVLTLYLSSYIGMIRAFF